MPVKFISYDNIDKQKWDDCISRSLNSLIYAKSFYLDNIADNWDALVLDDYEAVMPLVWRKKWGIKYLFQPSFIQQLGIFFMTDPGVQIQEQFIIQALEMFKYVDTTLNYGNIDLFLPAGAETTIKANYILPLDKPYADLYDQYQPGFTKSLRRIKKFNLIYKSSTDIDKTIALYHSLYSKRLESVTEKDIVGFKKICVKLLPENNLVIREVYDADNNLLAAALLLKDVKRLYNIISCITPEGKKMEANYFLYDKLLEEFSNSGLVLDLEGSDIKGVANFYKKFNPEAQPYLHVKMNDLHPVIKLFKR